MYQKLIKEGFLREVALPKEYNLSDIIRYNGKITIKPENVAEHSFYTALNVIKIGDFFDIPTQYIKEAVMMAVVHDIPEWVVGDIPFEFKRDNPKIMKEFEKVEEDMVDRTYQEKTPTVVDTYKRYTSGEHGVVSDIVDFADNLCAWQYANREYQLGNRTEDMMRVRKEAEERVDYYYSLLSFRVLRDDYKCKNI